MTTLTASPKETSTLPEALKRLWAMNGPLAILGLASIGLTLLAAVGLALDPRLITGAPAWMKPLKFGLSGIFYAFTLAWMLSYVKGHPRLVGLVSIVTSVGFIAELVIITLQVVRGVRSHFNVGTPLDAALFSSMGLIIMLLWTMNLVAAILLLRQKMPEAAFAWSIRLGVLLALVGSALGFLMTGRPTPSQLAQMEAGGMPQFVGAHSVGVEDDGPGLPVVGWSTEGGDIRVAHFVGLHGLQALPLIGLILNRTLTALSERRRVALVWIAGLGYLGLMLLLTWQALRGQSVIAPDAATLGAFAALIGAVGISALAVFGVRRQTI